MSGVVSVCTLSAVSVVAAAAAEEKTRFAHFCHSHAFSISLSISTKAMFVRVRERVYGVAAIKLFLRISPILTIVLIIDCVPRLIPSLFLAYHLCVDDVCVGELHLAQTKSIDSK